MGALTIVIIPLLLGSILAIFFGFYIRRPKLRCTGGGSGGGSGPGHHKNQIRIRNEPGILGVRLGETVILGKRIHGAIHKGLDYDRLPARELRAHLRLQKTQEHIGLLWWQTPGSSRSYQQSISLSSGESAELMVFARLSDEPSKYFVFEPISGSSDELKVPPDNKRFDDTREFTIEISDRDGRKRFSTTATMTKRYDGRLYHSVEGGGGGSF